MKKIANKNSTRYCASVQEQRIANKFNGYASFSSGSSKFQKSDVIVEDASLQIECKTVMSPKDSFSIKKEWIEKDKKEAFANRLSNTAIAFNFYYEDKEDFYVIDDKLMKFLVEKLKEEEM